MDNKYLGFLGGVAEDSFPAKEVVDSEKETVYRFYEEKMESGELIPNMVFSQHEKNEGLFLFEKGVKILLPNEEIDLFYKNSSSGRNLNRPFTVKVMGVDREARLITVSFIKAQEAVRPGIMKMINESLEKGKPFFTEARVLNIKRNGMEQTSGHVVLDIMGVGIGGVLFTRDWSEAYVRDIGSEIKKGDIIKVAVIEKSAKSANGYIKYRCSRKVLSTGDKWKGIEERYPLHSNVVVTCVKKATNYWLGKVKGLEDVTVYAHYPEPDVKNSITGEQLIIVPGLSYSCYVSSISEKDKKFRVRCKDILPGYMQKDTE